MTDFQIRRPAASRLLAGALVTALVLAVPVFFDGYLMSLAISGALLALAAMPLTLLTGTAGLLSLGQAAFLGLGGYTAGVLAHLFGLGLTTALFAAAAAGLVIGMLVALATLRVVGIYLAVGTFALQFVLQPIMQNIDVAVTHSTGFMLSEAVLFGVPLATPTRWWLALAVLGALLYAWLRWLQQSHIGRRWVVLRDTPTAAGVLGISLQRTRLGVFALTSAITASVGALTAYYYGSAQAGIYSLHLAILFLTIVALGGAGNLAGAIVAAFVMIGLSPLVESVIHAGGLLSPSRAGGVETILVGLILMVSLIVRGKLAARKKDD